MSEDVVTPTTSMSGLGPFSANSDSGIRSRLSRFGSSRSAVPEIDPLLKTLRKYHPKSDTKVVERAYEMARYLHRDQKRRSGDDYITHPVAVAEILADLGMTSSTLAAALLLHREVNRSHR